MKKFCCNETINLNYPFFGRGVDDRTIYRGLDVQLNYRTRFNNGTEWRMTHVLSWELKIYVLFRHQNPAQYRSIHIDLPLEYYFHVPPSLDATTVLDMDDFLRNDITIIHFLRLRELRGTSGSTDDRERLFDGPNRGAWCPTLAKYGKRGGSGMCWARASGVTASRGWGKSDRMRDVWMSCLHRT